MPQWRYRRALLVPLLIAGFNCAAFGAGVVKDGCRDLPVQIARARIATATPVVMENPSAQLCLRWMPLGNALTVPPKDTRFYYTLQPDPVTLSAAKSTKRIVAASASYPLGFATFIDSYPVEASGDPETHNISADLQVDPSLLVDSQHFTITLASPQTPA